MKAGVTLPQNKESLGVPAAGRGKGGSPLSPTLEVSKGGPATLTTWFQISNLQNWEGVGFCCLSPEELIQPPDWVTTHPYAIESTFVYLLLIAFKSY